ncbi:restriction endonuclease subunit S [Helicobacter sp. T3_23-1056]
MGLNRSKMMSENLNCFKWKEFFIEDIFTILSGKRLIKNDMQQGKMPFIGSTDSNNGITNFVSNTNNSLDSNVLGVNYNGSVCECFYHNYECIFSDDVKRFHLKHTKGNKYVFLFLKAIILKQKLKYGYGYKFNEQRMKRQYILLPINSQGQPNYEFMESFMRQIEQNEIQTQINSIKSKLAQSTPLKFDINTIQWKEFVLGEIFTTIKRGKRLIERDRIKGNIPYYSASKENNGLTDMIANPLFIESDKLIISTFCDAYFIEGKFTASDEITIFGNDKLNKFNGLFMAKIIKSNAIKYAFGHKAFLERLSRQIIKLPIDSNGNPHYEFMENYMRHIEQEQLSKVLAYYADKQT